MTAAGAQREDLVGCSRGDIDWPDLIARFAGLMATTARRHGLTGHEADEAAQRTWIKVVEYRHQVREDARFPGWFATVARRECLAVRRERWTSVQVSDASLLERATDEPSPCEVVIMNEQRWRLRRAVARLPQRERLLIEALLAPSEPNYAEVAATLSMPIGSIGPIRRRALDRLRRSLESSTDHSSRLSGASPSHSLPVCAAGQHRSRRVTRTELHEEGGDPR